MINAFVFYIRNYYYKNHYYYKRDMMTGLKLRISKLLSNIDKVMSMRGCCRATPWGVYGLEKFSEYIKLKEQALIENRRACGKSDKRS
jgi:hypothetical protein